MPSRRPTGLLPTNREKVRENALKLSHRAVRETAYPRRKSGLVRDCDARLCRERHGGRTPTTDQDSFAHIECLRPKGGRNGSDCILRWAGMRILGYARMQRFLCRVIYLHLCDKNGRICILGRVGKCILPPLRMRATQPPQQLARAWPQTRLLPHYERETQTVTNGSHSCYHRGATPSWLLIRHYHDIR